MIDICFSDTFSGLLKISTKSDGAFCLLKGLNYSKIDCDDLIEQKARKEAEYLKYFYKDVTEEEIEEEYENLKEEIIKKFNIFKNFLEKGHEIRLWVSNCAEDRCGLFWLCKYLENYSNKLYIVTCPGFEYDPNEDKLVENRNWAAFGNPYFVDECSKDAMLVYDDERKLYAELWDKIIDENAPLRILVNDIIVGVEEDFFDDIILDFVDNIPKTQRAVMGKFLGKWFGLNVSFVSKRIEHLISENKIKVCEDVVDDYGCYWVRKIVRS